MNELAIFSWAVIVISVIILIVMNERHQRKRKKLFDKWIIFNENIAAFNGFLAVKRAKGELITTEELDEWRKRRDSILKGK